MHRVRNEAIAQLVMALIVVTVAGFTALVVALPIGGAAFGMAPEVHLNTVGGLLCPPGSKVVFEEGGEVVTYSGDGPSYGTSVTVVCEDSSGVRTVLSPEQAGGPFLGAIGLVLGGYFLACFAPLTVLGLVVGGLLTHKLMGQSAARPPAQPNVTAL